ncbi:MAG: hypothetical protein IH594_06405 [Bacteroidales bacterium]|nr:hypothetical protein [Bacteroidales bacterium]
MNQAIAYLFSGRLIMTAFLIFSMLTSISGQDQGRDQWTENEAWEWHKAAGTIKGFNAPVEAYPGMSRDEIFRRAAELGYNSVRIWVPSEPDKCITFMNQLLEEASRHGLSVSPVLGVVRYFDLPDQEMAEKEVKDYLSKVIGTFRNDSRIILWDVVNEPALFYFLEGEHQSRKAMEHLEWCERSIRWAREQSPDQPVTISSIYLKEHVYMDNEVVSRFREVASMNDVHNFHLYDLSHDRMQAIEDMVNMLKGIADRPIVCTEAVARTRGGTFARSLSAFSGYHIHFYTWGMYTSDANWDVAWELSSFEPYEPWFHDVLHPDGTPYDDRDIEWVRNFQFTSGNEKGDPGAEITERWSKWRVWKWMAAGPVKGYWVEKGSENPDFEKNIREASSEGYNVLRIKLEFSSWKKDSVAFFANTDSILFQANAHGMQVMPVMLDDGDAIHDRTELGDYLSKVLKEYGFDPVVHSWELYNHPGETWMDRDELVSLLRYIFQTARFEFPNQPLTATPCLTVREFDAGFDYRRQLVHGHRGGWDRIEIRGAGDPALCNLIWSLSDMISIDSEMKMPETGWLLSVANRYGRPVFCTNWIPPDSISTRETLDLFSRNRVYWFAGARLPDPQKVKDFRFIQIATPFR